MRIVKNRKTVRSATLKTYLLHKLRKKSVELLMLFYRFNNKGCNLKLIGLASNKVYYFSKNLIKVYFVYPRIPSTRALA